MEGGHTTPFRIPRSLAPRYTSAGIRPSSALCVRSWLYPSNHAPITRRACCPPSSSRPFAHVKNELCNDPFTGTVFLFRAKRSDRLKLVFYDGTGLVMICKRLQEQGFVWPAIRDGVMTLSHVQFEALFTGLDWRRVRALSVRAPTEAE